MTTAIILAIAAVAMLACYTHHKLATFAHAAADCCCALEQRIRSLKRELKDTREQLDAIGEKP